MASKYVGGTVYIIGNSMRSCGGYDQVVYKFSIIDIDEDDALRITKTVRVFTSPFPEEAEEEDDDEELDSVSAWVDLTEVPGKQLMVCEGSLGSSWDTMDYWYISPEGNLTERTFEPIEKIGDWKLETYSFFYDHGATEPERKLISSTRMDA